MRPGELPSATSHLSDAAMAAHDHDRSSRQWSDRAENPDKLRPDAFFSGGQSTLGDNKGRNEPLRDTGHRRPAPLSTDFAALIEAKASSTHPVLGPPFRNLATDGPAARRGYIRAPSRHSRDEDHRSAAVDGMHARTPLAVMRPRVGPARCHCPGADRPERENGRDRLHRV